MNNFLNWVVSWVNVSGLDPQIAKDIVIIAFCFAVAEICLFLAVWVITPRRKKDGSSNSKNIEKEKDNNCKRNGGN
jgi:hypothetical protein